MSEVGRVPGDSEICQTESQYHCVLNGTVIAVFRDQEEMLEFIRDSKAIQDALRAELEAAQNELRDYKPWFPGKPHESELSPDITRPDDCPFCGEPLYGMCQSEKCTNAEGLYICSKCYGDLCPQCAQSERDALRAEVERLKGFVWAAERDALAAEARVKELAEARGGLTDGT